MKLNKSHGYVLTDVYDYDFAKCMYEMFKRLGYRIDDIDLSTKYNRNRSIGLIIRKYPEIGERCRKFVSSAISQYIMRNNLNENDIITTQFDGFISTKEIKEINLFMPLIIKSHFKKFIISFTDNSFIAINDNDEITAKGISLKPEGIEKYYKKILNINLYNKKGFFNSIEKLKNEFLSDEDINVFAISHDEDSYKFYVDYNDTVIIKKNSLKFIKVDNLDRDRYFKKYIHPFVQSMIYHVLKK